LHDPAGRSIILLARRIRKRCAPPFSFLGIRATHLNCTLLLRSGMAKGSAAAVIFPLAICLIIIALFVGTYIEVAGSQPSSSSTSNSQVQGVVTGYVTVSPSQPSCPANQACDVDLTGYSLVFTQQCAGPSACGQILAPLAPGGHYSVLLNPGDYSVAGLSPSCQWVGCASAFPKTVTVAGGVQLVFDVDIDTGIR